MIQTGLTIFIATIQISHCYVYPDILSCFAISGMLSTTAHDFLFIPIGILLLTLFIAGIFHVIRRIRRNRRDDEIDDMDGHEFEYFCAELLEKRGFTDVEVTRGSGDFGVDILAEKDGVTYAVQCKRYQGSVGVDAILQTYAGRDYYDRMVGAVMTNQYFTTPAMKAAEKLRILLWDRGYLDSMMEDE